MEDGTGLDVDIDRLATDAGYRREQARALLSSAGDVDHVELRRVAKRIFPRLARPRAENELAQLIGAASTMQRTIEITAITEQREAERRRREEETRDPPLQLDYPEAYAGLDEARRNLLIRFCAEQVEQGAEGRDALAMLRARYGWPYSDRTFYVGPWKAARLRRRKRRRREHATADGGPPAEAQDRAPNEIAPPAQPSDLDDGDVLLSTERARYQARLLEDGDWEVQVRARLDPRQMRRLHAEAIELFFGTARPVSRAGATSN